MGRTCKVCQQYKESENFSPFKKGKNGLYPTCKVCRKPKAKDDYAKVRQTKRLWQRAKHRAKLYGLVFTIKESDIVIPELCPVFHVPMIVGTKYAPSLDRKNSRGGYTKNNIQVISVRANQIKNDATPEELRLLADFLE